MSEWVEGRIARVLWRAGDGDWAVLRVDDGGLGFIAVGSLGGLVDAMESAEDGPFASFEGSFENHADHGRRFRVAAYLVGSPKTRRGLQQYLASSGVKGIGKVMARRIVDHFGDETTKILENEPARLAEIPGVGKKRAEAMAEAWSADAGARALGILLRTVGISGRLEGKIRAFYGDAAFSVVSGDPFRLARDIHGVGFTTADAVAMRLGMPRDDPARAAAAVVHLVRRSTDEGHTVLRMADVADGLARLQVPTSGASAIVDELVATGELVALSWRGEPALTTPRLHAAAAFVAASLSDRVTQAAQPVPLSDIEAAEVFEGITLDPSQRDAVAGALGTGVAVVTGGPGTGKTTIVKVMLRVAASLGENWLLASPTGRAARRLAEATGREASTIHRLLEYQPGEGFGRGLDEPLETDGVVIDEASMVDVKLMAALVRALPLDRRCRLVLVGDADQLPSVGAGQVLGDLIASGVVPVARLTQVHRQAAQSGIVSAAGQVRVGRVPASGERSTYRDFYMLERPQPDAVVRTLETVVTERLVAQGFGPDDVQVLTPTKKGPLGTKRLNEVLREAMRQESAPTLAMGTRKLGRGDRVICTKNRYDHQIFNGDIGKVVSVARDGVTIAFDDTTVMWAREELDQIDLAYAITVHKSQGSEYPAVVLVLHGSHGIMLRRNLVYTALTRASRFFCAIGEGRAWQRAVSQVEVGTRRTMLSAMLQEQAMPSAGGSDRA